MNIILTGLRGTGKSALGKALSQELNRPFIDLDEYIEKKAGQNIATIVKEHGWEYFRDLEHQAVQEVATLDHHIIATGGGTMIFDRNANLLKKNSKVILLTCHLEIAAHRISSDPNRPALTDKNTTLDELQQLWHERKYAYEKVADHTIDSSHATIAACTEEIINFCSPV